MQDTTHANRRRLLKMLGGAPMLPLGGVSMAALLTGCNSSDDDDDSPGSPAPGVTFKSASFTSMAAPSLATPELLSLIHI